jgi:threonine aldolase
VQDQPIYTADQVARAARELREAAGASQQRFTAAQVVAMLSDEVRLLRERGFSDERIADLFTGFDIEVTPEDIAYV